MKALLVFAVIALVALSVPAQVPAAELPLYLIPPDPDRILEIGADIQRQLAEAKAEYAAMIERQEAAREFPSRASLGSRVRSAITVMRSTSTRFSPDAVGLSISQPRDTSASLEG